jgi:hypothetical protein
MSIKPLELLGPTLLMTAFVVTPVYSKRFGIRVSAAICGAAMTFLPAGPTTLGGFFLGTFGPVSAASLVIVASYLRAVFIGAIYQTSRAMLVCLAVVGLVFYPLTFGLSDFDPYDLGYRGVTIPALMLAFVLVGWIAKSVDILCWILLAALLYAIGSYDSNNLWDYLIFPADSIYAVGALVIGAQRAHRRPDKKQDPRLINFKN